MIEFAIGVAVFLIAAYLIGTYLDRIRQLVTTVTLGTAAGSALPISRVTPKSIQTMALVHIRRMHIGSPQMSAAIPTPRESSTQHVEHCGGAT